MDEAQAACDHPRAVWLRLALLLAVMFFVARPSLAQAPSPSFFAGKSTDELRALASERRSDILVRREAATLLVLQLADRGALDEADAAAREFAKNIDPIAIKHAKAVRRRAWVHLVAVVVLALALGFAVPALLVARRALTRSLRGLRRVAPVMAFFVADVALVGGYLATTYENGNPAPFLLFGALLAPYLVVLRAWSSVGSPRTAARAGRAAAAMAAALALGFLVVEQVNPAYLDGYGL